MLRLNDNLRKAWSIIKDVINKKKLPHTSDKFMVNGEITSIKGAIAD